MIHVRTDGSASVGIRVGGWAYRILEDDKLLYEDSGYEFDTTNIRMEMTAIKKALKMVQFLFLKENVKIQLKTDSKWACGCVQGNWNCVENTDLVDDVTELYLNLDMIMIHVPRAELKDVDKLARKAMEDGKKEYERQNKNGIAG